MVTIEEKKTFKEALVRRLAEAYEEGQGHTVGLENETQAEREVVTEMKAERSIMEPIKGTVRFTREGYNKYAPKIVASRALRSSA